MSATPLPDDEPERRELPRSVSISSEKSLVQFTADSPRVYHSLLKDLHASKGAVYTKLSDVFKKATPIILIFGLVMMVALVMGNAPTIIDTMAKYTGTDRQIITETRIVYISEEEAQAQGFEVPDDPSGVLLDSVITIECGPAYVPVATVAHPNGECQVITVCEDYQEYDATTNTCHGEPPEESLPKVDEGFDIIGNLVPRPIPIKTGNETVEVGVGGITEVEEEPTSNATTTENTTSTANVTAIEPVVEPIINPFNPDVFGSVTQAPRVQTVTIVSGAQQPSCTPDCYAPPVIEIGRGGEITWVNEDTVAHTVTSGNPGDGHDGIFDTGLISAKTHAVIDFDFEEGSYPYYCVIHPWMRGTVSILNS